MTVEHHTADGHYERLPALAVDVVRRRPAAIIAATGTSAMAAKAATRDIPIIFNAGNDPVELGLVASLNRPGGNLTGITPRGPEIAEKRLELLHEAVPAIQSIALVGPADSPVSQAEAKYLQSKTILFRSFNVLRLGKRLRTWWTDGRSVRMDFRWAGGDINRIRAF